MNGIWKLKNSKFKKEVELTLECTVEQRSEQTLRLNIHVSKVTRTPGAHSEPPGTNEEPCREMFV